MKVESGGKLLNCRRSTISGGFAKQCANEETEDHVKNLSRFMKKLPVL